MINSVWVAFCREPLLGVFLVYGFYYQLYEGYPEISRARIFL